MIFKSYPEIKGYLGLSVISFNVLVCVQGQQHSTKKIKMHIEGMVLHMHRDTALQNKTYLLPIFAITITTQNLSILTIYKKPPFSGRHKHLTALMVKMHI